jgi:hypothetical protein
MLTRAIVLLALCLGLGAPAWAEQCDDLAKAEHGGIAEHWPDAKFVVYKDSESVAIAHGIKTVGGTLPELERVWLVISRPEWPTVRVVGFVDGCYEDHIDVTRHMLDDWLAGEKASQ